MSSIGDIAAGLKTNLGTIDGINVVKYPRSNPIGQLIHMWTAGITYHRAMQMGLSEVTFMVQLTWPYNDDAVASQIYDFLEPTGARSVRQAIESDKTLGGVCDRVQVESVTPLEALVTQDNQPKLTATWTVRILLNGST